MNNHLDKSVIEDRGTTEKVVVEFQPDLKDGDLDILEQCAEGRKPIYQARHIPTNTILALKVRYFSPTNIQDIHTEGSADMVKVLYSTRSGYLQERHARIATDARLRLRVFGHHYGLLSRSK